MNTLLDDNKLLCLANGQRIEIPSTVHMVFEVEDLRVASLATVSRCGMVYIHNEVVGWWPLAKSWVKTLPAEITEALREHIWSLCDKYIDSGLKFLRKQCKETMPTVDNNLVTSLCALFSSIYNSENGVNFKNETLDELIHLATMVFVFSYVWSIGGSISYFKQCVLIGRYRYGK